MTTKREAKKAADAAWKTALAERRVLRMMAGHLVSFPTIAERDEAIARNRAAGLTPTIVEP